MTLRPPTLDEAADVARLTGQLGYEASSDVMRERLGYERAKTQHVYRKALG